MAIDQKALKGFGDRVREWRITETVWSQEETGFHCGLSQKYISKIETGKKNITITTLRKLAQGFGIPVYVLCDFTIDGDKF